MKRWQRARDRGRSTCPEELVERCIDRQWGNSDVGNMEARISVRKIREFSTAGMGTERSICAPQL